MTKHLRFALLLVVVISSSSLSATTTPQRNYFSPGKAKQKVNANEKAIRQVEREFETALSKGDSATLDRILADDYVEIDAQGGIKKKTDILALARARARPRGKSVGPDITVDGLTIRIHGDSAAVVGRTIIRYQFMENETSSQQTQPQTPANVNQERFIRSYSRVNGRWRLVTWQTTSIAKR